MREPMSVRRCSACDFPWFAHELDDKGRCQECQPIGYTWSPGWRQRIARALADALARVSTIVGGQ